jgi:hypothetical protein
MSTWFVGTVCGLLALLGLFLNSRAVDDGMYIFGFALFGFGIFMIGWLMKRSFDEVDARKRASRLAAGD